MTAYLHAYETSIRNILTQADPHTDWASLDRLHERKLRYFQHERLIHLLVTLTTCLATLIVFIATLSVHFLYLYAVAFVLFILSIAYLIHYFKLENGVQRLYGIGDQITKHLTEAS